MNSPIFPFTSSTGFGRLWKRDRRHHDQAASERRSELSSAHNGLSGAQDDARIPPGSSEPHSAELLVEVRNLHKEFGSKKILQGIDLSFSPGAITTVLGPSGTGKTVLLKHLMGLMEPDAGQVLLQGQDPMALS